MSNIYIKLTILCYSIKKMINILQRNILSDTDQFILHVIRPTLVHNLYTTIDKYKMYTTNTIKSVYCRDHCSVLIKYDINGCKFAMTNKLYIISILYCYYR